MIAFIPLDDRPCCLQFPIILAEVAGLDIVTPPRASLGSFLKSGEPEFLVSWLTDNISKSSELLFSVDMLAYGGLVASRIFSATAEEAMERLKIIFELSKAKNKQVCFAAGDPAARLRGIRSQNRIPVYAFNSIMRVAPTASNPEEAKLAKKIVEYSVLKEFLRNSEDAGKRKKFDSLKRQIPADYLNLYFESRERNHLINKRMIYWVKDGCIDFLILGIDDSKTLGFNITEKGILESLVELQSVADEVKIYPGTDEMAMISLSRLILNRLQNKLPSSLWGEGKGEGTAGGIGFQPVGHCEERSDCERERGKAISPQHVAPVPRTGSLSPKIFPIYSHDESRFIIPAYEDRSIKDIISAQVDAAGAVLSESKEEADILLFVHAPGKAQKEAATQSLGIGSTGILPVAEKGIPLFINKINEAVASGKFAAVADVYYANGADNKFVEALLENIDITKLSSFAAWNTAGNSIGTAISHGIIRWSCLKGSTGFQPVSPLFAKEGAGGINYHLPPPEPPSLLKRGHDPIQSEKAHLRFLLMRFIDDCLYQSKIRQEMAFEIKSRGGEPSNLKNHISLAESILSKKILPEADKFFKKYFSGKKVTVKNGGEKFELTIGKKLDLAVCFPWHRLFEIELEVDFLLE